jgi:hypothetical protein
MEMRIASLASRHHTKWKTGFQQLLENRYPGPRSCPPWIMLYLGTDLAPLRHCHRRSHAMRAMSTGDD